MSRRIVSEDKMKVSLTYIKGLSEKLARILKKGDIGVDFSTIFD